MYFEEYQELNQIVVKQWKDIPNRYSNIKLDEFTVMPNHIHGIIFIVEATLTTAQKIDRAGARPAPTIGDVVGTFKSLCVNDWLIYIKEYNVNTIGRFWQRNYYEHIIRNDNELNEIREYIRNNPLSWDLDKENPDVNP